MIRTQIGYLCTLKRILENQPRSIVTNFTCKTLLKMGLFWTNSGTPTLTQSTDCPQHGGGSDVQHHALQEIRNETL